MSQCDKDSKRGMYEAREAVMEATSESGLIELPFLLNGNHPARRGSINQ